MAKMKFTDVAISRLKDPPAPQQVDYWDALVPAFGMRTSYLGARSWMTMVRVFNAGVWKQTRMTFGKYPMMSLGEAREKAREIQREALAGKDPRQTVLNQMPMAEVAAQTTYASIRDRYMRQHCRKNLKPKTADEYERVLTVDFKEWEHRPIASITKRDVLEKIDAAVEAGTPVKANRMLAYLSGMMNWAAGRDIIGSAPTAHVTPPSSEKSRDRSLSEEEIQVLWRALNTESTFGPLLKILLLTGQRREEVAQMRWAELKLDCAEPIWEIPRERVKMDRPHLVPLSPLAVEVLMSVPRIGFDFVFTTTGRSGTSGFSRAKARIDDVMTSIVAEEGLTATFKKPWVIHDLRRTCATHLAERGISRDVVELILNHRSGSRAGIVAIYNRSELMPDRRRALNLWGAVLSTLIASPKKSKRAAGARLTSEQLVASTP